MDWELGAAVSQSGILNGSNGDDKLIVLFRWEAVEKKAATEDGVPQFEDVEFVEIKQPGSRDHLFDGPVSPSHRLRFKSRYDAWKTTRENPVEGLPIEQWPLLTKARVAELKASGIRTVQELAAVPDSLLPKIGLFASQLRQKATDWLADGKVGAMTATLRKENDNLKDALEFEKKRIAHLEAQVKELLIASSTSNPRGSSFAPPPPVAPAVSAADIAAMVAQAVAAAMPKQEEEEKEVIKRGPRTKKITITPTEG